MMETKKSKFKISPIKLKVQFSSQGSNTISPKRKYSDYETMMNLSKPSSPMKNTQINETN